MEESGSIGWSCPCIQEGSGPCLFCGAVVCTTEEEEWMTKDSRKAKKLREQFFKKHNMQVSVYMCACVLSMWLCLLL